MKKQNNFFEEIANSVGGGGVYGFRRGETVVRKKPKMLRRKPQKSSFSDALPDATDAIEIAADVKKAVTEDKQLSELFGFGKKEKQYKPDKTKIIAGTFWDTTLIFAAKALYERLVNNHPVDPRLIPIIAIPALIANTVYDFTLRYKKYHLQVAREIEKSAKKLREDQEFRDKVYERIKKQEAKLHEEKSLNEVVYVSRTRFKKHMFPARNLKVSKRNSKVAGNIKLANSIYRLVL